MTQTIYTECEHCGAGFSQPYDPGRRRFCSGACKQAAYRARKRAGATGQHTAGARRTRTRQRTSSQERNTAGQEHDDQDWWQDYERWYQQQTRRQQRHTHQPPPADNGHRTDSAAQTRARRLVDALLRKAAATTFPHEAAAFRAKAEELRRKYHL